MVDAVPEGDERTIANMELVGGRPAIDFVNTLSDRAMPTAYERIHTFDDLVEWSIRVELLEPAEAERLAEMAAERPADAAAAVERARELREALFELFWAKIQDRDAPAGAVGVLNAVLAEGLRHRHLTPGEQGLRWTWPERPDRLDWMLWPLAWSAAELLTSPEADRLKECAKDDCRWLFLDLSRNHSRRWCTMDECGNRVKAQRHYHRHRQPGA